MPLVRISMQEHNYEIWGLAMWQRRRRCQTDLLQRTTPQIQTFLLNLANLVETSEGDIAILQAR
jgi:hypothetical protein